MVRARNSGACACGESLPESEVIDYQTVVHKGLSRKRKRGFIMKAAKVFEIKKQDDSATVNCFDSSLESWQTHGLEIVWELGPHPTLFTSRTPF
jgi:hypothetical protein